jgi:lysine 2,3-aminomutase
MITELDGIVIRKYDDRLLILTTDNCFSNCQYCFRQDILSNGDVNKGLEKILKAITSIKQIKNIRVHTRSIIYNPSIFDKQRIALLKKFNVRVVFHITHPYEICETVAGKITELYSA